jgi:hypothetical protein
VVAHAVDDDLGTHVSLPVFGKGGVGFLLARCARGPHPALPEDGEGK